MLLPARGRPWTRTPGGSLARLVTGLPGQRLRGLLVDSTQPHRARNPGRRGARLLLVLYAPDEGPAWMERPTRR